MNSNRTVHGKLFGGALFAAGIVAAASTTTAVGQHENGFGYCGIDYPCDGLLIAYDQSSYDLFIEEWHYGAVNLDASFYAENLSVDIDLSESLYSVDMSAEVGVGYSGIAHGYLYSYINRTLNVGDTLSLSIEWDFSEEGAFNGNSRIGIYETNNWDPWGTQVFEVAPDTAGSTTVELPAGEYRLNTRLHIDADSGVVDDPVSHWLNVSIPTPGSLAVLGVGFIGSRRRRRRAPS